VVTFTGIPYAVQPVDDLRFRRTKALLKFPARAGAAGGLGKACPQSTPTSGPDREPYLQDEACLFFQLAVPLSFFTDNTTTIERAIVTVHGGAFIGGSSGQPLHDYRRLASLDGVASFIFNYRLGLLGFLTDDKDHYNAGFHDQQLAIAVIADVAAALGVQRTLLAGESAGACSVAAHLLATPTGYDATLLQSMPAGVRLTTIEETEDRWALLMLSAFCYSQRCIQGRSVDIILSFQKGMMAVEQLSLFDFHPDNFGTLPIGLVQDGEVFTDNAMRQYVAGDGRHEIPVMIGSLRDESLYLIPKVFPLPVSPWYYPMYSSLLVGRALAGEVRTRYPLLLEDDGDVRGPLARMVTSWVFGCGTNDFAQGAPDNVFYYFYTNPNSCSRWNACCVDKACHADDLHIFYNSSDLECPTITTDEATLGAQWRWRVWKMLDGGEPWAHPQTGGADGVEIGQGNWSPVSFDREANSCDFWEVLS
jgi:carboxylesterase type B